MILICHRVHLIRLACRRKSKNFGPRFLLSPARRQEKSFVAHARTWAGKSLSEAQGFTFFRQLLRWQAGSGTKTSIIGGRSLRLCANFSQVAKPSVHRRTLSLDD